MYFLKPNSLYSTASIISIKWIGWNTKDNDNRILTN